MHQSDTGKCPIRRDRGATLRYLFDTLETGLLGKMAILADLGPLSLTTYLVEFARNEFRSKSRRWLECILG